MLNKKQGKISYILSLSQLFTHVGILVIRCLLLRVVTLSVSLVTLSVSLVTLSVSLVRTAIPIDNVCLFIRDNERIKASMRSTRNSTSQTFLLLFQ